MKARTVRLPPPQELEGFLAELKAHVPQRLFETAQALVAAVGALYQILDKKRYAMAALRRLLFGQKTETTDNIGNGRRASASTNGSGGDPKTKEPKSRTGAGHGRRKLRENFPGAQRIFVTHPGMTPQCECPNCAEGKMYRFNRTSLHPRIFGQPFLVMLLWELEGWRCGSCQQVVWAPLPTEARGPKYDPTARSMLAVMHYRNGLPFHCIQQHQEALGVFVSLGVQWQMVSDLARLAAPVYKAMRQVAARGEVLHNDDTRMKILALGGAIGPAAEKPGATKPGQKPRTGLFTTVIISRSAGQTIALYCTGRRHAGENLAELGRERPADLPVPIQMCDGLEQNATAEFKTLLGNCMGHGRRKFVEVAPFFEQECLHVLEVIKEVCIVDALARDQGLSASQRLQLHQEKSGPLLEELRVWMNTQFLDRKVEPNSGLGKAFKCFLKRWDRLTLFLREPGAPIDNNICERGIKIAVRYRKNSLFYKTQRGADVGDCLMSLIHTCDLAGANAFEYLTALQVHHDAVITAPEAWLPWNYKTALAATTASAQSATATPPASSSRPTAPPSPPASPTEVPGHPLPEEPPATVAPSSSSRVSPAPAPASPAEIPCHPLPEEPLAGRPRASRPTVSSQLAGPDPP